MRLHATLTICCSFLSLTAFFAARPCHAAEASGKNVVIRQHSAADDGDCFALAVRPTLQADTITRHVLLVDTSASQVGTVRGSSLQIAATVISRLPASHKFQLFAVDVACDPLTRDFVSANGPAAREATEQLQLRTPLGTTDLAAALSAVSDLGSQDQPVSVLYIGDGFSSNRISESALRKFVDRLVQKKMSVHSVVLGPKTTTELPGILANLTGGTVTTAIRGSESTTSDQLVKALQIKPVAIRSIHADDHQLRLVARPNIFLRPDRHTIVFGTGTIPEFGRLSCHTSNGLICEWTSNDALRESGGAELTHLIDRVRTSKGINSAVSDLAALDEAHQQFAAAMDNSIRQAKFLAGRGKVGQARDVLKSAAEMDATNRQVSMILTALSKPANDETTDAAAPAPGGEPLQNAANDNLDGTTGQQEDALSEVAANVKLQGQILAAETNDVIDQAKQIAAEDPDYASNRLKGILDTIESSADISPDVRIELKRRVIAAIGDVKSHQEIDALRRKQVARDKAVKEAQERLLEEENIAEKRLGIQIEKIRGLLERGRHGDKEAFEDAEYESRITLDQKPRNGPATQALVMSEALGQLDKAYNLVNLRHDRFLEVLYQVELSHVPFPDEPPIQYPPADVWRALTLTRKPRYESTDLRTEAPVEKWLRQMLDKPVRNLDFPGDTPLSEILDTVESYFTATYGAGVGAGGTDFKMTIYPDQGELSLEQISSLEDVTITDISFDGMSLRNALKLIFDQTNDDTKSPVPLTYVIQNEVMMITTKDKAESADNLVTRVYPVADLVISPAAAQQLGGGGGLQGGGGGLGGGQQGGGFGGGQQGGGFGGGGQGFMSLPPEMIQESGKGIISIDGGLQFKKK